MMRRMIWLFPAAVAAVLVLFAAYPKPAAARTESPAQYCRRIGTDDTVRSMPASLVPAVTAAFGLTHMPPAQVQRSTFYRCMDHQVLACWVGANLPCGKADTSRDLPGAQTWCRDHPGSDFIPMYVTGHDTIYQWRCNGPDPAITRIVSPVDARGFIARFWKPLP